ncbi:MAG: right-handed parallel beta-helix repeat-containing protein [Neomegalonema sp.]|nr:right-handed parallel beta-helix repeat-containing protein [Neomegalonema sp.]
MSAEPTDQRKDAQMAVKYVTIPTASTVEKVALAADVAGFATLGYHALGDGGGGVYERVEKGSADKAAPGDLVAKNGTVYALKELRPNARQFGARGDGKSDDSAALQAAIDAGVKAGALHLPPGRYKACGLEIKGDLTLTGEGATLVWDATGGEPADMIKVAKGGLALRHLIFEGAIYQGAADAISTTFLRVSDPSPRTPFLSIFDCCFVGGLNACVIGAAEDVLIENVRFERQKGAGITLYRGPRSVIIRNMTAVETGDAAIAGNYKAEKRSMDRLTITDFTLERCGHLNPEPKRWQSGVTLAAASGANWQISNGTIIDCQGGAVDIQTGAAIQEEGEAVENVIISNLNIEQPGNSAAIKLSWVSARAPEARMGRRVLIANNILRHRDVESRTGAGIALAAWGEVQIVGNLIENPGAGMRIRPSGSSDDTIRGLSIKNNRFTGAMVGIEVTSDGALEDVRISGNEIRAGRNAILFDGAVMRRVQIDNNQIEQVDRPSNLEYYAALQMANVDGLLLLANRIDALGGSAILIPEGTSPKSGGSIAYNVITSAFVPCRFGAGRWQLAMNDISGTSDDGSYIATDGAKVYATFTFRGIAPKRPEAFGARGDIFIGHAASAQQPFGWLSDGNSEEWIATDIEMGPAR